MERCRRGSSPSRRRGGAASPQPGRASSSASPLLGRGDLTGAEAAFRAALIALPGYPFALDWLARVEAARGRVREAIRLSRAAVETPVPLPQFAATTDLLRLDGREREAREQERLVASIERLLRASGGRPISRPRSSTSTTACACRRRLPPRGGDSGASEHRGLRRPRLGARPKRPVRREALPHSRRALRLGTRGRRQGVPPRDDPSLPGSRGGRVLRFRRALAINPHFSLVWSPAARRYAS